MMTLYDFERRELEHAIESALRAAIAQRDPDGNAKVIVINNLTINYASGGGATLNVCCDGGTAINVSPDSVIERKAARPECNPELANAPRGTPFAEVFRTWPPHLDQPEKPT